MNSSIIRNKNSITQQINSDIDSLTEQMASLSLIGRNEKKEFNNKDIESAKAEINKLTNLKGQFKAQLTQAKFEFQKVELEREKTLLMERRVSNDGKFAAISYAISQEGQKIHSQKSELANLKVVAKYKNVHIEQKQCEQSIAQCKNKISELKEEKGKLSSLAKKGEFDTQIVQAQIFNLNDMTRLKNKLIDCKTRLKQLRITPSNNPNKDEDVIKLEMKEIIKEMIHSKSYLSLLLELRKAKDCLANLEYLKNEKLEVNASEIDSLKNNINLIEKQIELEITKVKLQEQLKEAQDELVNLTPLLTVSGIEDVSKTVKATSLKIAKLTEEITKITFQSLAVVKSLDKRAVEQLQGNETAFNVAAVGLVIEELQKWLAENILEETLGGNLPEAVVTTALLRFAKVQNLGANPEPETSGIAAKIKGVAVGACEKFCMGQAVQHIIIANPIMGALYASGLLAQHLILGDGQLSTLRDKVATFAVAETIKTAGNLLLGGVIVGVLGNGLAITASTYLLYMALRFLWNAEHAAKDSQIDPTADISAAGIDMVADATVSSIFDSIFPALSIAN